MTYFIEGVIIIYFSEAHIIEFVEAFNKFDEAQTGLVSTKQLGNLMRNLGINPTKEELQDLTIQIDPHVTGYLKLPDLLDMMSRIIMERNYDAQIEDAFRCFDKVFSTFKRPFIQTMLKCFFVERYGCNSKTGL